MAVVLPISAVIPTRDRRATLARVFESVAEQSAQPAEIVIVDASRSDETEQLCRQRSPGLKSCLVYHRAEIAGAIEQRNQAMSYATQDAILFMDDDIILEPECIARLWQACETDPAIGGVNALITNQRYFPPGTVSRTLFRILHGRGEQSYAGRCIGPACNILPEDREDLPAVVEVEWLNTTCTLYRKKALPNPPFVTEHVGKQIYLPSFPLEDMALSIRVGKHWKLANARTARIYHDSQPGAHKKNIASMSKMELLNRHYVMTRLLDRRRFRDYLKLALAETFGVLTPLTSPDAWKILPAVLFGKASAIGFMITANDSQRT